MGRGIELRVGVENLLDKEYHDHLTREAIMPVGDLGAGDEIPQPGRSIVVGVRYR
jgi:outer membrane receptor protein involved in Fe transport